MALPRALAPLSAGKSAATLLLAAAAGLASATGIWIANDTAVTGGVFVSLPLFAGAGWWLAGLTLEEEEDRRAARRVFLLALALRLPALFFLHASVDPNVLAPDQVQYDKYSMLLLDYWQGKSAFPSMLIPAQRSLYFSICASFYWLFGQSPIGPKLLNAAAGSLAAALLYRMARHLGGSRRAALLSGVLAAAMPSLILWSVLQLRDALALLGLAALFEAYTRFQERPAPGPALAGALSLWLVLELRDYLVYPLGAALAGGALVGRARQLEGRRALAAVTLFVLAMIGAGLLGYSETFLQDLSLEKLQQHHEGLAFGGSAFGIESNISSPTGALAHLPLGLVYFLLAPFPWQLGSIRQALAVPEMFLWYALLPFVGLGAASLWRRQGMRLLAVAGFLVSTTVMYSLVEGNEGTAFRHRAQVLIFFLLLAGEGLAQFVARRARHREAARAAPGAAEGGSRIICPDQASPAKPGHLTPRPPLR